MKKLLYYYFGIFHCLPEWEKEGRLTLKWVDEVIRDDKTVQCYCGRHKKVIGSFK